MRKIQRRIAGACRIPINCYTDSIYVNNSAAVYNWTNKTPEIMLTEFKELLEKIKIARQEASPEIVKIWNYDLLWTLNSVYGKFGRPRLNQIIAGVEGI